MVNQYISGREQNCPPCSARTGCWACGRISKDTSAENMISAEGGKHAWMKPLLDLRNYMLARHFDPSARCWLARTINEENRDNCRTNAYAPGYTLELLRLILTMPSPGADRCTCWALLPASISLTPPANRSGLPLGPVPVPTQLHGPAHLKEIYEQGKRYDIPDLASIPIHREGRFFRAEVPFADEEYFCRVADSAMWKLLPWIGKTPPFFRTARSFRTRT